MCPFFAQIVFALPSFSSCFCKPGLLLSPLTSQSSVRIVDAPDSRFESNEIVRCLVISGSYVAGLKLCGGCVRSSVIEGLSGGVPFCTESSECKNEIPPRRKKSVAASRGVAFSLLLSPKYNNKTS